MIVYDFQTLVNEKTLVNEELSLAIGVFDGVHLGHQNILKKLSLNKNNAVITFNINPKDTKAKQLTTTDIKLQLFEKYNIKYVIIIDFLSNIANMSGSDFLSLLCTMCRLKTVIVGEDFKCGNPKDSISALTMKGEALKLGYNIEVDIVKTMFYSDIKISTTHLKSLIQSHCDLKTYKYLTGNDYVIDYKAAIAQINNNSVEIVKNTISQVLPACGKYSVLLGDVKTTLTINDDYLILENTKEIEKKYIILTEEL